MIIHSIDLSVITGVFLGKYLEKSQSFIKFTDSKLVFDYGFCKEVFPEAHGNDDHNIGIWIIGGVYCK